MASDLDPLDVPLLGHGGLLDTLNHALTTASALASVVSRDPSALEDLRSALARADAVSSVARNALAAGATREQRRAHDLDPRDRDYWLARHADNTWTAAEAAVLRRITSG